MADHTSTRTFSLDSLLTFLYCLVVGLIPLAVRVRDVHYPSPLTTWAVLPAGRYFDAFAFFRLELLVVITGAIVIVVLLKLYYESDRLLDHGIYLHRPMVAFGCLVAVATLANPYPNIAFWGAYQRYEGAVAYFCYLFLFIGAAVFLKKDRQKRAIFFVILAAGLIHALIGISQFFGFDPLQVDLVQRVYIPSEYLSLFKEEGGIKFQFAHKAYGLTYNPNYFGGLMAMLFPVALVLFLYARSTLGLMASFLAVGTLGAGLIAPTSAGALIAAALAVLALLLLTRQDFRRYYKRLLVLFLIGLLLASAADVYSGGKVKNEIKSMQRKLAGAIVSGREENKQVPNLLDRFPEVAENEPISIEVYQNPWDRFATNRGYIWRKSVELMLQRNVLLGSGLDTFLYTFPHWDAQRDLGIFRYGGLIDKPHNTYLQIGIGVGLLGLLVYLYILARHALKYHQALSVRGIQTVDDVVALALFAGWLGYLFQGLTNDSVLSNAPVFWVMFGLSVNYVQSVLPSEVSQAPEKKGFPSETKVTKKKRGKKGKRRQS